MKRIAKEIRSVGYDGIIYPSYYSLFLTGSMPQETFYGVSIRKLSILKDYAKSQIIGNLALFGYPVKDQKIEVKCINKVCLKRVNYDIHFGPVLY